MKKLILVLAIFGLAAGCANRDHYYSGGTDESFHSNATYGTGSGAALTNRKADNDNM